MFEFSAILVNKTMMKKIIALLFIGFLFASCEKKVDTYRAEIYVTTESGIPIQNALVKLTFPGADDQSNSIVIDQVTGIDGIARFEIKNKAFYDIRAWKAYFRGCSYVEFKKNETVRETVIMRNWDDPYNGCID